MSRFLSVVVVMAATVTLSGAEPVPEVSAILTPDDSVPTDTSITDPDVPDEYSFKADKVPLHNALTLFARTNGLELVCDDTLEGTATVSFENVSFGAAMERLLSGAPYTWHFSGKKLFIVGSQHSSRIDPIAGPLGKPVEVTQLDGARIFKIDYPRLKRSGQGSSAATISSSASGEAGRITLSTSDDIQFWQELEEQLRQLLSPAGKLVISKMTGIVHVADTKDRLDAIEAFIQSVVKVATRQVEITARIYEVSLDKDHSLGIDWNMVAQKVDLANRSVLGGGGLQVIRSTPDLKVATTGINLNVDDKVALMVNALKEQGNVHAVSQPRILTLNNQPALIKIGTDYPYFSATVTTNATTGQREVDEEVRIITVGVILSVTPQISDDGWIILGIDPLISDLVSTEQSEHGSTAPVIDVKQSSALVRLYDRTTVRISGLLQKKKRVIQRKVPLLGDIPVLKYLFQWSYTKETQRELVIFITPRRI